MPALINARYRIVRTLGETSQGSIFLVEDTLYDDALAALKTFHSGMMDDVLLNNLRVEFYTLSRFKHPNIAQVFDVGTIHSTDLEGYAGSVFFTMEYIEGPNLLEYTAAADREALCGLVLQIAYALDYIHRHGLIHFDIKPGNIIVTDTGQGGGGLVKIIDFGFASPQLDAPGRPIRGTLEYMAPELLRGDSYDHRIDLYSLGVTLYELLARCTPFHGTTATETIKQHLSSPVPPLPDSASDAPACLHELMAGLLEKEPEHRIASAADIVRFLRARLEGEFFLQQVLDHVPLHRLIGRENEVQRLTSHLLDDLDGSEDTSRRHPAVTIVTGESGIGKTALLQEVKLRAQTDGLLFFETQCFAGNAQPYEPFVKLLRDQLAYARAFGPDGERVLGHHTDIIRSILGGNAGTRAHRLAHRIDDPGKRLHFIDRWANLFFAIASLTPYAVVIDTIEDADESTVELLGHLLRSIHKHRIKFFISGIAPSSLTALISTLQPDVAETLPLAPLDEYAVLELMNVCLNTDDVSEQSARMLTERYGSLPSVLLEFLSQYMPLPHEERAKAVDRDLRTPDAHGKFADVLHRIYRLKLLQRKPEELFLLRTLSCFDAPVSLHLFQQVAPFNPLRVKYFLDRLLNVGIIRSVENGNRWYFSQSRFKEFIYASFGSEKAMLHTLIADTMADANWSGPNQAEIIAHQYRMAGSGRKAYPFFLTAAEQKRSQYALHESLELLNEACRLIPSEEIAVSVFEDMAECYSLVGDYQNAVLLYEQLRSDEIVESKRCRYAKELGLIYSREGHLDEAYALLLEAAQLARSPEEIIEVEEELAIIDISRGKYTEAFDRCSRVLQSHRYAENSPAITGILNNLGIIHFYGNNTDEAAACFLRSILILQNEQQKSKLISPYLNLGNVYGAKEEFAEAARYWQLALGLTQEVGNLQQEARAYNNIGIAFFKQGNHDDAAAHYEKAYEIFSRLGFTPGMALCLTNIGEVHLANALYEKALTCWQRDLALYESLHDEHGMIEINLLLAGVHRMFGHTATVGFHLEKAEAMLAGNGTTAQQALFRYTTGLVYDDKGDIARALTQYEEADRLYTDANDRRNACLAKLKRAEAAGTLGSMQQAAELLEDVYKTAGERSYQLLQCEALLQLGLIAAAAGTESGFEPAITYYTHAFDIVQTQIVTETTWNVCWRLGNEYYRRGMEDKGALCCRYAQHALEYLASEISSDTLRTDYLGAHRRRDTLRAIGSRTGLPMIEEN